MKGVGTVELKERQIVHLTAHKRTFYIITSTSHPTMVSLQKLRPTERGLQRVTEHLVVPRNQVFPLGVG